MQWLFLTLVALHVATFLTAGMKNQHIDYLLCTPQTEFNPGVCDCTTTVAGKCFIKLTITKNKFDNPALIDESQLFSVNGGRIGPTIIAKYNQLIVADVYNEINDTENPENSNVSMHWHGMKLWGAKCKKNVISKNMSNFLLFSYIKQLLDEAEHDIKNYSDRGQCYLPKRS